MEARMTAERSRHDIETSKLKAQHAEEKSRIFQELFYGERKQNGDMTQAVLNLSQSKPSASSSGVLPVPPDELDALLMQR